MFLKVHSVDFQIHYIPILYRRIEENIHCFKGTHYYCIHFSWNENERDVSFILSLISLLYGIMKLKKCDTIYNEISKDFYEKYIIRSYL